MGQQGVGLTSPSWGHACSLPRHALPSLGLSVVSKGMGRLLFPSNCVTGAHGMLAHVYVCLLQASASHSVGGPARSSCPSALLSCSWQPQQQEHSCLGSSGGQQRRAGAAATQRRHEQCWRLQACCRGCGGRLAAAVGRLSAKCMGASGGAGLLGVVRLQLQLAAHRQSQC
jgi:hypothetical protein